MNRRGFIKRLTQAAAVAAFAAHVELGKLVPVAEPVAKFPELLAPGISPLMYSIPVGNLYLFDIGDAISVGPEVMRVTKVIRYGCDARLTVERG